jgi:hypothetical protein
MKSKLLILILFTGLQTISAQQLEIHNILPPYHPCIQVLDSLDRINYFAKCRQVLPEESLREATILYHYSSGCFINREINLELVYDGRIGYLIKSDSYKDIQYKMFTNSGYMIELLQNMNHTFAFDSIFMLHVKSDVTITGMGGGYLKFDLEFTDGERIIKNYSIDGYSTYCAFYPSFMNYYEGLFSVDLKPLDAPTADFIKHNYHSMIAGKFLQKKVSGNEFPYLIPRGFPPDPNEAMPEIKLMNASDTTTVPTHQTSETKH